MCLQFCLQISVVANLHFVKSVRILRFIGPYFPEYGEIFRISPYSVRMRENADQENSEYEHFSRSAALLCIPDMRNVHKCL